MQLYLVCAADLDAENRDHFVTAACPEDAARLWAKTMHFDFNITDLTDAFDPKTWVRVYSVPVSDGVPELHRWKKSTDIALSSVNMLAAQ